MSSSSVMSAPVPELMSHGKRPSLRALTSIRFFAAMYVVFFHYGQREISAHLPALTNFLNSGYSGVTLFFSLSGFILAYNYPSVKNKREFWIARFARVYPVYFVILMICVLLPQTRQTSGWMLQLLAAIFLVQAWWPPFSTAINPVAWTLSVEAFFYALFPFLLPLCRRLGWRGVMAFLLFYGCILAFPVIYPHLGYSSPTLNLLIQPLEDSTLPLLRLGTFVMGMLAGIYFSRTHRTIPGLLPIALISCLVLLCWPQSDPMRGVKTFLLSCSYTALIYALAKVEWAPLTNKWLLLGGEVSYSIYLLQLLVFRIADGVLRRVSGSYPNPLMVIPPLIFVSYLSFRFIEVPMRRVVRNALLRKTATQHV